MNIHEAPSLVKMDNGTDMTCNAVADWRRLSITEINFIDPESPLRKAHMEPLNGQLRDELLAIEALIMLPKQKITR